MKISPTGPSAAQVFTGQSGGRGDNSGSASILDTYGDGLDYVQDMYAKIADVKLKAQERKKKDEAAWGKMMGETPEVWQPDLDYVYKDLQTYNDELIDMKVSGLTPEDIYSPAGREALKKEQQLTKRKKIADDNFDYYTKAKAILDKDTGKYNKAYAAEWFKKYSDPKLTPEERATMRQESNPFKMDIDIQEVVAETVPEYTQDGRFSYVDPKAHYRTALQYYTENPDAFEAVRTSPNETLEQVVERTVQFGQDVFPKKRTPSPMGRSGGGSGSSDNSDVSVEATYDESVSVDQSANNNVVLFRYNTQNPKLTPLLDDNGKSVTGKVLAVKKTKDNTGWKIDAEVVEPNPAGGTTVKIKQFSVDNTRGNRGHENYLALSDMIGIPLEQVVGDQSGGNAQRAKSVYVIKGKEYTLSELQGMGYTEEQVRQYKK